METSTLCLGTGLCFDNIPTKEQLPIIKNAGFDAVFTDWAPELDFEEIINTASSLGLAYQSLHAPFHQMDSVWHDANSERAVKMLSDIRACIDVCSQFDIKIAICHAIIGMNNHTPTKAGLEKIAELIEYADKKNVTLAFENTEGEEYLQAIFERFGKCANVGFCFDSGHEMCYTSGMDLLKKYGQYLVSTHLNDNLGQTDPNVITFYDDAHLLPFDGIADWDRIAQELKRLNFTAPLTFELNAKSRPHSHANDIYAHLSFEEYVREAFLRADKFRNILKTK